MEPHFIFFLLVLLAGMVLGPIFGFVAWWISRETRQRLKAVEGSSASLSELQWRVTELEARLEATKPAASAAPAAPREAPEEAPEEAPSLPVERPLEELELSRPAAPVPEPPEPSALTEAPEPREESPEADPAEEAVPPDRGGSGPGIDWERWIGLRGAAVLGGVVLALAALLFLKYSIEAGLIPPVVRVALAVFAGLGALGGSQVLRRREYETTANALAGAGIVTLYGAVWAARALYGLIGVGIAYLLMTLVTAVCGLLSWRHRSLVVAVLGLAGGFATPALLTSGSAHPVSLFGYLLLLNLGILALARRRGWPLLAFLSVLVTGLYQAGWIVDRMRGGEGLLALLILAVFAALFAVGTARMPQEPPGSGAGLPPWLSGVGAVAVAFVLALHLSGRAQLGDKLLPLVGLLVLLSFTAQWMGRVHGVAWLPLGAAGAVVAAMLSWLRSNRWGEGREWPAVGGAIALALAFHLYLEWRRRREGDWASVVAAFGLFVVLLSPPLAAFQPKVLPWVLAWAALAALLVRQAAVPGLERAQALAALGLGVGAAALVIRAGQMDSPDLVPGPWLFLAVTLGACAAFQALGLRSLGEGRPEARARWADVGAYLLPLLVMGGVLFSRLPSYRAPLVFLGGSVLLTLLMVLAATRRRSGGMYAGGVALLAFTHLSWTSRVHRLDLESPQLALALGLQVFAVILLTFWPVLAGRAFAGERGAWIAAALAGPAWFLPLRRLYESLFGDGTIGILPLALGGLSLFAALRTRHLWGSDEPLRKSSLVWFAAVALGFVSLAVPLQLDEEWVTVAWALEGLASLALWKRLDHPGLKYFSLALLGAVTVRLVANPAVLSYHPASGVPLVNWLSYTYLIPAACLLGSAYFLHRREVERRRPWEEALYNKGISVAAGACGLAAILVVFAWINLSIADFFSTGPELTLAFERAAARDLTTSLAWGLYALLLLAIGIARGWAVLRWISLAFLVLTIGKVFLYDLGELKDLYRVASLVGLAGSLILVSLIYQRFVFKPPSREET